MLILSIRPAPPGASSNTLAYFDAEVSPELRLYNLVLRQYPDGNRRTAAPNAHGRHTATFAPTLGERLTNAATIALRSLQANEANRNAA